MVLTTFMDLSYIEKVVITFLTSTLFLILLCAAYALIERALRANRTIYDVPTKPHQRKIELAFNLLFTSLFSVVTATLFHLGLVRFGAEGPLAFATTFIGTFLTFDIGYYFAHRAMHTRRFAFMHDRHHFSQVCTPWTSFSVGPWEAGVWMVAIYTFPVVASSFQPLSIAGLGTYLVLLWIMNVFGHVNVEIMPAIFARGWASQIGHPNTFHAIHHARYVKHYSFVLTVLDKIFATVWDDWARAHARVLQGTPLRKLPERVK